jgi:dTDP-4-dehydrorhamnose 3,5-epimerase
MQRIETGIPGLYVIEPRVFEDERGHFYEAFNAAKLEALGIDPSVVQMNHSFSKRGVLRGLHFQLPPYEQTKLVRCVSGRLYDAVVDIRKGSPTYGKSFGIELSAGNRKMLFVPKGFAHGFCAITDCELLYAVGGGKYHKDSEGGLRWDCRHSAIAWPVEAFEGGIPNANERDLTFPSLKEFDSPFVYSEERMTV